MHRCQHLSAVSRQAEIAGLANPLGLVLLLGCEAADSTANGSHNEKEDGTAPEAKVGHLAFLVEERAVQQSLRETGRST